MADRIEVKIPDIGDFADVEIIELMVQVGQSLSAEQPILTLESDKAAIDVPSPAAGTVAELLVAVGDEVSEGTAVLILEVDAAAASVASDAASSADSSPETGATSDAPASKVAASAPGSAYAGEVSEQVDLLVLGAGPGGYTAAFRAADLGRDVMLVERYPTLGGVCLNVGCIPSKALLHAAKVVEEAESMHDFGIRFGPPQIDSARLREWKNNVVGRLTGGLGAMARQRKVKVMQGVGEFLSPHHLEVRNGDDVKVIGFTQCIVAAGSQAIKLPMLPDDPRVLDSTSALEVAQLPERMLVIGGGIIGLELGTVYDALGVKVSVVELTGGLMPGADHDMVRPLQRRLGKRFEQVLLNTKVTDVVAQDDGLKVFFEGDKAPESQVYEAVLAAVGRRPNGNNIGAEAAGLSVDERGFVQVDQQMRSNVDHIFAIGDIVGQPMLAHKATHEAKVAAEVACGMKRAFDARVIPSVAYTDPEVAWVGLTELEAKAQGIRYGKGEFPWAASGRSLAINREEGLTKLLIDETTERVIGAGIVGPNAGDLIAEAALAIEMGCDVSDIGLTVHPHPTLSETVAMAAEVYEGTITDLYLGGKKRKSR